MSNSLTQYIDLFNDQRAAIEANAPAALNALRANALAALRDARLPRRGEEGFERTSIEDMFAPDFGVNVARVNLPVDIAASFRCDVPNITTLGAVVANDKFVASSTLAPNLPKGVKMMSLAKAAAEYPELVGLYYGSVAPLDIPAVALDTLFCQDGVFVHVDRGVHLDKPLQVVNIFSSEMPLMAARRVLVVAEEGARVNLLLCDHCIDNGTSHLNLQVIEVVAGVDSSVQVYDLEESGKDTSRYSLMFVRQHDRSSFLATSTTLLNGITRNAFHISIEGERCATGLYGMAIAGGKQHVDNSSTIVHRAPRSTSNQLFKYVLEGESVGAFEGGIEVTPEAPFTEAYQSNNNILASEHADMHTKPQLLIYNDDVKCSHGATTGQLNDEALFYMQTRGIPRDEARRMLMQAFMVDVINTVEVESLRDRLRHLVEKRFDGTLASCPSCSATCRQ